jgi:hypothetical protein
MNLAEAKRTTMKFRALFTTVFLVAAASVGNAQATIAVRADSRLWIEGASNVSRWRCKATTVDAVIHVDSAFRDLADLTRHVRNVTVSVPVAALTCGHAPMDRSLRAALKPEDGAAAENIVATLDALAGDETERIPYRSRSTPQSPTVDSRRMESCRFSCQTTESSRRLACSGRSAAPTASSSSSR